MTWWAQCTHLFLLRCRLGHSFAVLYVLGIASTRSGYTNRVRPLLHTRIRAHTGTVALQHWHTTIHYAGREGHTNLGSTRQVASESLLVVTPLGGLGGLGRLRKDLQLVQLRCAVLYRLPAVPATSTHPIHPVRRRGKKGQNWPSSVHASVQERACNTHHATRPSTCRHTLLTWQTKITVINGAWHAVFSLGCVNKRGAYVAKGAHTLQHRAV